MKSIGIVRKLDKLGRIVIPKELRKCLKITEETSLEVFTDNEFIILQVYNPGCLFCESMDNIRLFKGRRLCEDCRNEISNGIKEDTAMGAG